MLDLFRLDSDYAQRVRRWFHIEDEYLLSRPLPPAGDGRERQHAMAIYNPSRGARIALRA